MRTRQRLVHFGAQVRSIRVALGMGQRALAGRIDRSQAYISLLERGNVPGLSIAEADVIARALGATLILGVEAPVLGGSSARRRSCAMRCVRRTSTRQPGGLSVGRRPSEHGSVRVGSTSLPSTSNAASARHRGQDRSGRHRWPRASARLVPPRSENQMPRPWLGALGGHGHGSRPRNAANDDRIRANASACVRYFRPLAGPDVRDRWCSAQWRRLGLAMIDPRSRVRAWCRPTVADGRRSQAPYRHIADFPRPR